MWGNLCARGSYKFKRFDSLIPFNKIDYFSLSPLKCHLFKVQ